MEKIPYKPGDVLVSKSGYRDEVIDLSKNEFLCFIKSNVCWVTKEQLDDWGYTLKTPKEDGSIICGDCKGVKEMKFISCDCSKETPTPWRPRNRQNYYYISNYARIEEDSFDNDFDIEFDKHEFRLKSGNCFRTREEAEEKYKEILSRPL